MSVSENVAYLKGLMEGLDLDEDKKETKLFNAIIETLDEIASELSDMEEEMEDLADYIEEIDEDLGEVEEFVYEDLDDCDCCDCCGDDEDEEVDPHEKGKDNSPEQSQGCCYSGRKVASRLRFRGRRWLGRPRSEPAHPRITGQSLHIRPRGGPSLSPQRESR